MASLVARLHSSRFQFFRPYSSPCHRCMLGLMAHHSYCSCASYGRGPGSGRRCQPRSSGRPSGSGRGRGSFSFQNSGFFSYSRRWLKHVSRRGLKYVPTSDQGDRDFYTQLTHAVETNHPADNSDVWVPVTTKGVKSQVDFSLGGFSSSYMRGCPLSGKNKFSGSAN